MLDEKCARWMLNQRDCNLHHNHNHKESEISPHKLFDLCLFEPKPCACPWSEVGTGIPLICRDKSFEIKDI
jgi:hypothetical protein